jgi:hypothetical protein
MSLKVLQAFLMANRAMQTEISDRKLWCGSLGMIHYVVKTKSFRQTTKTSFSLGLARLTLYLN